MPLAQRSSGNPLTLCPHLFETFLFASFVAGDLLTILIADHEQFVLSSF
jgi:hypothetical protein